MINNKKAALYIRVSSEEQTEYSPDSQLKILKKYAKENNIDVLNEYIYKDDGISGKHTDKRLAFQKMINDAKMIIPKPFDVILVYSFSRFARNREDSIVYKSMLRKKLGIDVISATQNLSDGKESVIMEAIYEAMDEYYSLDLAENVKRGRQEKASRGEWNGKAPYGYDYDRENKTLKTNEKETDIVKLIYRDFIETGKIKKIATKLNNMNVKTKSNKKFDDRTIKYILTNVVYTGKITNDKNNVFDGKHEPIISWDKWEKVQNMIKERKKLTVKYQKKDLKKDSWLKGLLKCSKCNHSLVICNYKGKEWSPYFQCGYYSKSECKCSQYILVKTVEETVKNKLKEIYTHKLEITISNNTSSDFSIEQKIILDNLENLKNKEKRIKTAYEEGIDTIEEYKQNKERLTNEKQQLNLQLEELNITDMQNKKNNEVYKKCEELYKILSDEKTNNEMKFNLAHLLIDKIIFDKASDTLEIYYK